jgi:hypothetical protein
MSHYYGTDFRPTAPSTLAHTLQYAGVSVGRAAPRNREFGRVLLRPLLSWDSLEARTPGVPAGAMPSAYEPPRTTGFTNPPFAAFAASGLMDIA